uniref:Ribosomal protein n=1 Tax=Paramoeba aestuarina TaxID=180227 RepID=A0A7S4JJS5_9EUKA|mmetsp:Transcript_10892/g.16443  ORF Transcript_10892/g.16443 Transcript_10892/m.16443 type:complete len:218 (+) Transcript_10892:46-699(+)|eukprot:CAMPEP_0201519132 /NCGR_PEP_ID=MMETSP0161_2-20130828/9758_1 /ASSEMBLY_ACC=CAM_ASM_000251 /TAXON_ID=180227 /ORGANISM="Neoparamoeba aestuarina, Strain SoJaBio B1-5/56/2" /LENGTH=217 /DNA_ID=CAMNT_0047917081 /DNA_START=59 /DNA_END=712 /DNA_ORIENTATION=+
MSKLHSEALRGAIQEMLKYSNETKKRNFTETVELQIALKNYDPTRDKRFKASLVLKHPCKPNFKFCVLGNQSDCDKAKALGVDCKTVEELKAFNKNKKLIKKMAQSYDVFFASESLIRTIPRILGPTLNRAQKFPLLLAPGADLKDLMDTQRKTVKLQLKKVLCLGVAVGNVTLTEDELVQNIFMTVNFLVSLLKKNWQNIKNLYIKSSMGPAHQIY